MAADASITSTDPPGDLSYASIATALDGTSMHRIRRVFELEPILMTPMHRVVKKRLYAGGWYAT
jgi:hypothetical protein